MEGGGGVIYSFQNCIIFYALHGALDVSKPAELLKGQRKNMVGLLFLFCVHVPLVR